MLDEGARATLYTETRSLCLPFYTDCIIILISRNMKIVLTQKQANDLISFVEEKLSKNNCDHSLKHTRRWALDNKFDQNDLIDILEANGGWCDCEVTYNLPADRDICLEETEEQIDKNNPWKIPQSFKDVDSNKVFSNFLISTHSEKNRCYTEERELLVPAPKGAKPKKRIRRSVHFFIGIETGLPSEVGFIEGKEPISPRKFAKIIRDSGQQELKAFGEREAGFFLSRLEKLKEGNAVGTHFSEITGITSKREELRVHKVILRKDKP